MSPPQKEHARTLVVDALTGLDWGRTTRAVRINDVRTPWAHQDVVELVSGAGDALDVIIVPKVKAPRDVWFVETLLDQLGSPAGLEVLIEEVEGLIAVEEIARCSPRVEAVIFGPGDLSGSQEVRVAALDEGFDWWDVWLYARTKIVVAARAAGVDAVDGPFASFRDADGYRREARRSSALGYVGKWAIHPDQVPMANEVFSPTEKEVSSARKVVDAYSGAGMGASGGMMVDAATIRIMENVLARARLIEEGT